MRQDLAAHRLVRETAIRFAVDLYVELMQDNERYAKWKAQCPELTPEWLQREWVRLCWPTMIERARATLAGMLKSNISEDLKIQISDALIKDNYLRAGKVVTRVLN